LRYTWIYSVKVEADKKKHTRTHTYASWEKREERIHRQVCGADKLRRETHNE